MKCKICIKSLKQSEVDSGCHSACLKKLFGSTKVTTRLSYPHSEFQQAVREAVEAGGMSISGVQPKAQMELESKNGPLVVVDSGGEYILKPTPDGFPEAAINEHLSMQLARLAGFEIPECGLLVFADTDELAFLIRRFDRFGDDKLHHEDMMQLMDIGNQNTDSKYDAANYSTVINRIKDLAGLGVALECFRRVIFNYHIGNDDYHLKNISLMHEPTLKMTPVYDSLNTQLYSGKSTPSIALKLTDNDGELPYFGTIGNGYYAKPDFMILGESAGLSARAMTKEITKLVNLTTSFCSLVLDSLLSEKLKQEYVALLKQRKKLMLVE